jgi:hypothetical protein
VQIFSNEWNDPLEKFPRRKGFWSRDINVIFDPSNLAQTRTA